MSDSNWIVMKFGGTSVSSRENWEQIATVIQERRREGYRICMVHSALSGISNQLQEVITRTDGTAYEQAVENIKKRHLELAGELGVDDKNLLRDDFAQLEQLVKGISLVGEASYRVQAKTMALGELMATRLGADYLKSRGVEAAWTDVRQLLVTVPQKNASEKALILSAVCSTETDEDLKATLDAAGDVVLTQGFFARDDAGQTVLLGRGGSDVSAAYLAAKIDAARLEIWTDVPGLFSANPQTIPSARLLRKLSYEEAQEIATSGAKILHPRCIMPARRKNIPLYIKCTPRPDIEGTVISSGIQDGEPLIKAIAVRKNVTLVSMESLGMWQQVGFLADAFNIFKRYGLSIDLVSTSDSNVTVSLDPGLNTHFTEIRSAFVNELSELCKVTVMGSTATISLLGRHIRAILHELSPAFEVFREHHVYLVSQAANDLNFTLVVDEDQADRLVRQIHDQVISQAPNQVSFGLSWQQLMHKGAEIERQEEVWWKKKRRELIELAQEGPVYVYDLETVRQTVEKLTSIKALDQVFYAMKANVNSSVLKQFYESGLGFECVSLGEVNLVLELFPDIDRNRILFTPNFAPRDEYKKALELGIHVTLDNIYPLRHWPGLFQGKDIFIRIDPGYGQGHHTHVRTGGTHSKFGIPRFELDEVRRLTETIEVTVKGIHAHLGSGIKDPLMWKETAVLLAGIADDFGAVEVIDVGGGLGIRENEMQPTLDIEQVARSLDEFQQAFPGYRLWMEPGRYLVAAAGVLLARITQLKGKGEVHYVGIDTGMNSLIRPALYGAHHTIVNLTRLDKDDSKLVNVVGPICESGDKLGIDRLFPESEEGDVVLIANAGAYGRVMASSYNLRMPAGEKVI